jgi:outer membrane protein OmpA-like peptidoglycan-associated protein
MRQKVRSAATAAAFGMLCFLVGAGAEASSGSTSARARSVPSPTQDGWRVFGGVGLGYGAVSGQEFNTAPKGAQYLLNMDLGFQAPRWVGEGGIGWFYNRNAGQDVDGQRLTIRTRSALAEASLRYRVSERWQFGPVVGYAFGADTAQGATIGDPAGTFHLGARAVYELPWGRFPVRIWQQVTADTNVPERRFVIAMAGVQIGIPIKFPKMELRQDAIVTSIHAPVRAEPKDVLVVLDPQRIFFKTNSAELRPEATTALAEAGELLRTGKIHVETIDVGGHADRRGRFEYNLKLSEKRARVVASALVADGSLLSRVKLKGYSYTRPIDPSRHPEAWAKNRRVEILFKNVSDAEELQARLKPLMTLEPAVD